MSDTVSDHEGPSGGTEPALGVMGPWRPSLVLDNHGHLKRVDIADRLGEVADPKHYVEWDPEESSAPGGAEPATPRPNHVDEAIDPQDPPYWGIDGGPAPSGDALVTFRSVVTRAGARMRGYARRAVEAVSRAYATPAGDGPQRPDTAGYYDTPHGAAVLAAYEEEVARDDEQSEDWRAYLAREGTQRRLFQLERIAEPGLPKHEVWYRAEAQARAELAERCPDGNSGPSMHPWDLAYVRLRQEDDARRDTALAALERQKADADQQTDNRLAILAARRAAYTDGRAAPEEVFNRWEEAITASHAGRAERYEQEKAAVYDSRPTIEQRIAATTRVVPLEPTGLDTMLYYERCDKAAQWQSNPLRPDFERARDGLRRVIAIIRGTNQPTETRTPAESYWDNVASVSEALLAQGETDTNAYEQAQRAAAHRALSRYGRDVVVALAGDERFLS